MEGETLKSRDAPRIPGYRIEGVLGRGATGTVYRARQLSVDRLVALKVLHEDLVGAKGAEKRLQREARATGRLAHPHIISAIDLGQIDGRWWYAMELVDGVSLQERMQAGTLSEREALRTFIAIAEALQHAFERGVVHRDVKPANILLERGGRALLVDLGLAFAEDDPLVTKSGTTLGTPHYISPEQARDPSQADVQSDLWSLGATMYHAVCGRPPFSGESVAEILSSVLYEPIPDPGALAPQISSGFALILRKCLTRDRSLRYATPAELFVDLERVRERRAPNVRRSALEPVAQSRGQRARRSAAVVVGAGLLAWFGWYAFWPDGRAPAESTPQVASDPAHDPTEKLLAAAEGATPELGPALARAVQLTRSLRPDSPAALRAATARAHIEGRLAAEIQRFQVTGEPRFTALVREHRYEDAAALVTGNFRHEFAAATGGAALPPDLEETFEAWLANLTSRLELERRETERRFRSALSAEWREHIQPEVRAHIEAGRWRSARSMLTTGVRDWAAEASLPRAGISEAVAENAVATLRESEITSALAQVDARWAELDTQLRGWVEERTNELRGAVEGRTLSDGASVLRTEWSLELERQKLAVEEMPAGLLHLALEEFAKGERELAELARNLAVEDARRGLAEFEEETQPAWRARRYTEVAEMQERAAVEVWRQPVRAEHELRAREARLLEALLQRAAEGIALRDGERVEMTLGTIKLSGKLAAGSDPLARGFTLILDGGRNPTLALRAIPGVDNAIVVGRELIETFARVGNTPDDRLLAVLFRLREGEASAAREGLDAGALPRDDPLVADAERRVQEALDQRRSQADGERDAALARYHLALREGREGTDPARLARRIEKILREDAALLGIEQIQELRRLRDDRLSELTPPVPSLEELMRPNAFEPLSNGRVRLRYDFASARAGGFDPGSWIREGQGFVSLRDALSDDDLLTRPGPSLVLRDPAVVQSEPVDVRLRFQPKPDAPANLLLVTVCGFHTVIAGGRQGRPARLLVDTGEPAALVARARAGEGTTIGPPRNGTGFELRVLVTRSRGIITVELDGRRILVEQRPVPRNELGDRLVSVKSFEPLRLVSAAIEVSVR